MADPDEPSPRPGPIVALAALAFAPALGYLLALAEAGYLPAWARPGGEARTLFLLTQGTLLFLLLLFSATAGELFGRRAGMAGRVGRPWLAGNALWLCLGAAAVGAASLLLYDRRLAPLAPGVYPQTWGEALVWIGKNALTEELVLRYGVLSLLAAATGRFWLANPLAAAAAALVTARSLGLAAESLTPFLPWSVATAFAFSLAQGFVFRHGGLAACVLTHGVVSLKVIWFL